MEVGALHRAAGRYFSRHGWCCSASSPVRLDWVLRRLSWIGFAPSVLDKYFVLQVFCSFYLIVTEFPDMCYPYPVFPYLDKSYPARSHTAGLCPGDGASHRWHTPHPRSCPCCPEPIADLCIRPTPAPLGRIQCCPFLPCKFWLVSWWFSSSPPARTES